jgi:hypothetical protein
MLRAESNLGAFRVRIRTPYSVAREPRPKKNLLFARRAHFSGSSHRQDDLVLPRNQPRHCGFDMDLRRIENSDAEYGVIAQN